MEVLAGRLPDSCLVTFHIVGLMFLVSCMQTSPDPVATLAAMTDSALSNITIGALGTEDVSGTAAIEPATRASRTESPSATRLINASPSVATKMPAADTMEANTRTPEPIATQRPPSSNGDTAIVSGYVLGGGDTTPPGLLDAPRTFIYEVQQGDGTIVQVSYIAYPPSPVGDRQSITLNFYAGAIRPGDYLIARGSFEPVANTLTVSGEGDYIETYPQKP